MVAVQTDLGVLLRMISTNILCTGGITAFIGATIFEIGGVLLFLEAINADREQNFGWAFLADLHRDELSPGMDAATRIEASPPDGDNKIAWVWAPSWHDFSTHLIFDLGFLASLIMVVGCTIFYIPGILALPQLYQLIEDADVVDQAFWTPLVVGGVLFVVSGVLYVLETQEKWVRKHNPESIFETWADCTHSQWKPAPKQLGWHIAMWTLVGAIGFLLSPLFGLFSESDNDWALWQSNFSSLWGTFLLAHFPGIELTSIRLMGISDWQHNSMVRKCEQASRD